MPLMEQTNGPATRAPRTPRIANPRRGGVLRSSLRWAAVLVAVVLVATAGFALYLYVDAARTVPPVPPFETLRPGGISVLTAHDGQVIAELYEERRLDLAFDDVPAGLILALLAAEDERFFEHSGLDVRGVLRAVVTNIQAGEFVEGASTLTQQLAKSVLGRPADFGRGGWAALRQKLREAIYARRMEDVYTKEEILLLYLNRVYLGNRSYGIRAAAQNYFRKDVGELNLTEMALLAGLPQAPSALNPLEHPERARDRLVHVLGQMARNEFITEEERAAAAAAPLVVYPPTDAFGDGLPYFARRALAELDARFGTPEDPRAWRDRELRVSTTADLAWGRAAAEELAEGLRDLDRKQGYRGPLAQLSKDDWPRFFARVGRELRGREPSPGSRWPALVESVKDDGLRVRLTDQYAGAIATSSMSWAGRYEEGKRVSFGRKLKKPAETFSPGDIVLVRVEGGSADELTLALDQEPKVEGAVVVVEPDTEYVKVLQGGYDWDRSQVLRFDSVRQSGSTIKPAIYSLAYDLGLAPSTILSSAPFREGDYAPTRGKGSGDLMVWDALAQSENNVSLRIMNYVQHQGGKNRLRQWTDALGLTRPLEGYTAEVLGVDQTAFGLTTMMATFARRGLATKPTLLRRVEDADGRVLVRPAAFMDPMNAPVDILDALVRRFGAPPVRAVREAVAYITAANLRDVFRRGTARREGRKLKHPAAGKTGTLEYDVWFTGFTRWAAATVWIGADRRERILGAGRRKSRVYGSNTALPAWRVLVDRILDGRPKTDPVGPPPDDVVVVSVDPETGRQRDGAGTREVPHVKGTEPPPAVVDEPQGDPTEVLQTEF